jgi:hypothetical protein
MPNRLLNLAQHSPSSPLSHRISPFAETVTSYRSAPIFLPATFLLLSLLADLLNAFPCRERQAEGQIALPHINALHG